MSFYKMRFYIAFFPLVAVIGYCVYQWPEVMKDVERQNTEFAKLFKPSLSEIPGTLPISDERYISLKKECELRNSGVLDKDLNNICSCYAYNMFRSPKLDELLKDQKSSINKVSDLNPDLFELYKSKPFHKLCLEKFNY
jgi:hypothetical protein